MREALYSDTMQLTLTDNRKKLEAVFKHFAQDDQSTMSGGKVK
jgi:hypothetical protein